MNKQKTIVLVLVVGLITGTAGALKWLKTNQRMGRPGIKTSPIAGSPRLDIFLPEEVMDYKSKVLPTDKGMLKYMPQDTSFAQREYVAPDGFEASLTVVLMGTDRTSIHKPQFCLEGNGWKIDDSSSAETTVRMHRPKSYDLPVMKLTATKTVESSGQTFAMRGIYVYWFVADGQSTARHSDRMWRMTKELLKTATLQRWAYISCFSVCRPGNEAATFERVKRFIAESAPEFQLVPGPEAAASRGSLATAAN